MASVKLTDQLLTMQLLWWEKLAAHRSHFTVPLRAIKEVRVVDDVYAESAVALGRRIQATRLVSPVQLTMGSLQDQDGVVFAVCRGSSPMAGVVLELEGMTVARIVFSAPDAAQKAERIAALL